MEVNPRIWTAVVLAVALLCVAADDKPVSSDSGGSSNNSDTKPLPAPPVDTTQERHPVIRTYAPPQPNMPYDSAHTHHHDLKTSGSADYPYAYAGVGEGGGGGAIDHYGGPVFDHGHHHDHHDHYHVEDHGHHESDSYHVTPRDVAFGFLTFLIILSNLQGALINLSKNSNMLGIITTTRRRRDLSPLYPMNEVPDGPLPFPTKLDEKNWLFVEDKQVRCVQHSVCETSRQLTRELGITGKVLGRYFTGLVSKTVDAGWTRLVADAGTAGLSGVDCSVLYRGCHGHLDPSADTTRKSD